MKKLFLIVGVLAMSAGVVFAQGNDASIDQTGDDHSATIEQVGSMNESFVVQTEGTETPDGTVAVADIYQEGDANYVNLNQRAFYGSVNSEALIDQVGDDNTVMGVNEGDAWYQNQTGGLLDVWMKGDRNTLRSLRTEAQKNKNYLTLDIEGSDNDVAAAQEFGDADIDITGGENTVSLWQMAGANFDETLFNTADVDVVGDVNTINVSQVSTSNNAVVDIMGDNNSATVTQTSF
ncbi:curlin repeat-containing protein [Marinilabilia rubra]|uniref:Curlin n=1 Tax=Marinilabilia rubra TaxID=2162893 RepID=A0A2U2B426_9BACT|nr:curlin repeat-containing protein [Marinilabilia rubra]PWD97809.1 hypothetical protein DDZ16_18930 [Marinilabilia rubra]